MSSIKPMMLQRITLEHPVAILADEELSITVLSKDECKISIFHRESGVTVTTKLGCTIQNVKYKEWVDV